MATPAELRRKAYEDILSPKMDGEVPLSTKNVTVEPPKEVHRDAVIQDTVQKIQQNKAAREIPVNTESSGIDWGAIGKGGLDLLGKGAKAVADIPTSALLGIRAGQEPNIYRAGSYGRKSGQLSEQELRAKEAEATRNLETQKIKAAMEGKQIEAAVEAEKARKEAEAKKQEQAAEQAEKERQEILEGVKLAESKGEVKAGSYAELATKPLEELQTIQMKTGAGFTIPVINMRVGAKGKFTTQNQVPSKYKVEEVK